jgi:hypothetical protein
VREGGKGISEVAGGKDVEKGDDTDMDGPEGDVDMEVDGDALAATKSRQGFPGTDSPTSRIQPPTSVEQSSPISSDVEPSSQSASSNDASGQLGRENIASPLDSKPIAEEGKPSSTPASQAGSTHSSPRTQASGSGSIHPSLKSTTSRKNPGLTFPIVMSSGPASPRMDTTSAGAEDMVGIVSADEVQTYVGELVDDRAAGGESGRSVDGRRRVSLAQDTLEQHEQHSAFAKNEDVRQNGRGRRASSPGRTFRNSVSSIPITSQHADGPSSLSRSLTEQTKPGSSSRRSLAPSVSQPQRFKRFVGNLFRSKSVSSAADDDGVHVDQDGELAESPPTFERSPRRTQSMASSAPPLPTPHNGIIEPGADLRTTDETLAHSPSVISTRSATHPGSITPRIRTRSERSTSPRQARAEGEMELDSEIQGVGHSPKRSKSRREPGSGSGKPSNGAAVEWKCRPGSVPMDGVVSGLGC